MTRRKPDRALRRALADLRRMDGEDRGAIIDLLEPADRQRIEALLRSERLRSAPEAPPVPFAGAGYSDWLVKRLATAQPEGMTAEAAALLRDCARERQETAGSPPPAGEASGLARLTGLLRKGRRAA